MEDEFGIVTFAHQISLLSLKYVIVKKNSGQLIINIYHTHSIIFEDQIIIPYLKQY